MEAMSVLEEFRQRRKLLENLRVNSAKPRLKGMWDFLQKERETIKIISKIPPVDHLISKASPTKQIEAEAPDEIRAVGFYIMEECSKTNKRITEIVNHLGIISKDQKLRRQNYADNAMTAFVNPALDFVERELEKLAQTPRKKKSKKVKRKSTKRPSKRSPTKQDDKRQAKQDERIDGQDVSGDDDEDFRNVFRENLIAFLVNEKKFPRESMNHGIVAEAPDMDLAVAHPDTDDSLAVFDCKSGRSGKPSPEVSQGMARSFKSGLIGIQNPFAYIVHPSEESNEDFVIFEVEDDGTSYEISYGDFPTYKQLVFASPLSNKGRRICWALTRHAKDEHGFSVHAPCEDYINLQIKKNGRTAAQIHRVNDAAENIALALAGYQEDFPEAKLPPYMFEGKVKQLSGYTSKSQGERNWLEGNLGHQELKYEAGVYILRPGALVLDEVQNEVGDLLELAKRNAVNKGPAEPEEDAGDKEMEFAKDLESPKGVADVVGNVATIQIEGIGEKDRLGRDNLVKTLAGMFAQTECDNGFTMALLGDWGQGKSTVMGLLEKELNRKHKGKFEFAKYNAWEYENAENIAAGMAQEVVSGIIDRTRFWERQKLRFYFALLEYGKNIRRVMLYIVIAVLLLWLVSKVGGESTLKDYGVATGWVALLIFVFVNIAKIIEHPISVKLETYLSLPNYRKHLGLVPVLRRHINTLCSLHLRQAGMRLKRRWLAKLWKSVSRIVSSRRKVLFGFRFLGKLGKRILKKWWSRVKAKPVNIRQLVLFVDDLDRCNVDHIVKVFDAIRLVMTIPNVIVMIGIDHRIAFKAIGKHYEELADGNDMRGSGEIARDYLGKIIQLPLRLRAVSHSKLKDYVFDKLFDEKNIVNDTKPEKQTEKVESDKKTQEKVYDEHKEQPPQDEHSSKEQESVLGEDDNRGKTGGSEISADAETAGSEEEIAEAIKDKTSERDDFYELAGKYDFSNPRQLLRLHNSFRFLKGYGRAKGEMYDTLNILKMLFWQEFLHNWPVDIRGRCMAELTGEAHGDEVKPIVKKVLDNVRDDIGKLFNGKDYAKLAEFVRIVVLPHDEEGIFDTKEEIDEWLKKRKEKEKEAQNEIMRVQLVENSDKLSK
jgi:hypothetical protein